MNTPAIPIDVLLVFFYVIGYIIIASAQKIATVAGGIVIYAVGYTRVYLTINHPSYLP
jgi:hypothetical protein